MCLSDITEDGLDREGIGYKVISKGLSSPNTMMTSDQFVDLQADVWNKAKIPNWNLYARRMRGGQYESTAYKCGFHIWLSRAGAKNWCGSPLSGDRIVRVRYRKGHTVGRQYKYMVIVADEMYVSSKSLKHALEN